MTQQAQKTAFLDRDGTINQDFGYVTDPAKIVLLPGAAEAIALLREEGFKIAIISNQSAVGRGMASIADIDKCNQALRDRLLEVKPNTSLDAILYCADHPEQASDRRKPGIGLLRELPWKYEPQQSWMFGDKRSDIEFGENAGLPPEQCILIGEGERAAPSLLEAVQCYVLKQATAL